MVLKCPQIVNSRARIRRQIRQKYARKYQILIATMMKIKHSKRMRSRSDFMVGS